MDAVVEQWTGRLATLFCQAYRQRRPEFSDERLAAEILGVAPRSLYYWRRAPDTLLRPGTQERLKDVLSAAPADVRLRFRDMLSPGGSDADDRLTHAMRSPGSIDLASVAELRQQVHALDEEYDHVPSASLLPSAGQALGQASFLVANAPKMRVRKELRSVETDAATLMGQLVWDASLRRDHATARKYLDQAIHAGREIGDLAAEGHALLRKSYIALYGEGDPGAGLALTEQAADTTLKTSHVLTGLALLHSADANAILTREQPCKAALSEAESHFERVTASDVAAHLFSPTQLDRLAGSCYLYLGDLPHAESALEQAASQLHRHNKSRALVLGNLSLTRVRQGNLDGAALALHEAIDVLEINRGAGGLNKVFDAVRQLRRWQTEPTVKDVHDRLFSLMTTD